MSFGDRLREARERRGISLRQIAGTTKIPSYALEALERNEMTRLPGGIFSRAFVRSYAIEVGLDPEATVRDFLSHVSDEATGSAQSVDRTLEVEEPRDLRGVALKLLGVAALVAVVVAYVTLAGGRTASTDAPSGPAQVVEEAEAPRSSNQPPPADEHRTEVPSVQVAAGLDPSERAVLPPVGSPGPFRVDIHPTGSCWVSLTVDGDLIVSRVMQPGERLVREVRNSMDLAIGNAGQFAFTINDRPGRSLGREGEVVRLRVASDDYERFIDQG